jgi:dihydrofolate synthase / folylpolyglutamate synthase
LACPHFRRFSSCKTVNYRETLDFLNRRGNEVLGMHLGLHRIQTMMGAMGNPNMKFPALHIAGTNGKGSVAAMSESILRRAGWKTGLYTSPHLVRIEERIKIDGQEISPRTLARLATEIQKAELSLLERGALDRPLTFFEIVTAAAFLCFAQAKVDIAVVEVGLGGLLDATNVVAPQVCIITGISHDHQSFLGTTLAQIAAEKAGIIKPGIPVISGCRGESARRVILQKARAAKSQIYEIDKDCRIQIKGERDGCALINLHTPARDYARMRLSLAGEHQVRNAALAVMAMELLKDFPVQRVAVRRGLASTIWPGRMDSYRFPRRTLIDGAHNREGAQCLREFLSRSRESEIHLVFAALRDKDIKGMGACLFPLAQSIHLAQLSNARSAHPTEIKEAHRSFHDRIFTYENPQAALKSAWQKCSPRGLVVVSGSLYLIGALLPTIRKLNRTANM